MLVDNGLDGHEIPPDRPAIRLHEALDVHVRRWPTHYLTPTVLRLVRAWRLWRSGSTPLTREPVAEWPAFGAHALLLLEAHATAREAHVPKE